MELKWINPLGPEEQTYLNLVNKSSKHGYTVFSWISPEVPSFSKIVGCEFFGKWRVEILLDGRKMAEELFTVDY